MDERWTLQKALDLYNIPAWSEGHFHVTDEGEMAVSPAGPNGTLLSLKRLAADLSERGIDLPVLVRCSDVLQARIDNLHACFANAIGEYDYEGVYRGVYPIKVNQQRHVVEEILRFGAPHHFGLEAGSKPELMAVIALLEDPEALILCNGYKDEEYVEIALLARRMGRRVILVAEQLSEVHLILKTAERLGVEPVLGVRAKLSARGAGHWEESAGDRSKFGLSAAEIVQTVDLLREREALGALRLLHFHLGSQITDIRPIKAALREASRLYVELVGEGARMGYLDVGGGLGVDYDGSRTNFVASTNYSVQEYANDVVAAIQEACDQAEIAHPTIVSESGRAITAHHAVLLVNVLEVSGHETTAVPKELPEDAPQVLINLHEAHEELTVKNLQETFHDVVSAREELSTLFNHGVVGLRQRAIGESIAHATLRRLQSLARKLRYVPEELEGLERLVADTYFCNFSTFQSIPDAWAVDQLFPVVPLQRLGERPTRRGIIGDMTCDSDGKLSRFIDLRDVKDSLELHAVGEDESYLLGIFLVGAYQETLGDLHNLFGDSHAVHVAVGENGDYELREVIEGDRVSEVLHYVQYSSDDLLGRLRRSLESAVQRNDLRLSESKQLLQLFRNGLEGYTYLE
ncbi:MAG: biosynthetic arginine decarboxylase [Acidobacteriota bacterium]